jgi:chromosome segregation ATPase
MQPDTSTIPHGLLQILGLVLASSLGWVGGWLTRRKREPHEIAKISAETRQISVNTDVSLISAATTAITKAERLQDERDHWERKATDLMIDLEESRNQNAEKDIRLRLHEAQVKRMELTLKTHGLNYDDSQDKQVGPVVPK